ncbi:MAG: hypothetical protein R3353_00970 [Salegentibacter mishustinae]|nr:hypothetical protein [Salegentibacter mishustinae]
MKLNKVKIQNFTCFLEPVEFSFGNGLNIVNAENGAGKSQLLDSIYWCIYGEIFVKPNWVDATYQPIYPAWYTNPENQEHSEEFIETKVDLEIEALDIQDNGQKNTTWYFSRTRHHMRNEDTLEVKSIREEQTIKYIDGSTGEHILIPDYQKEHILKILFPKEIKKFMWFQGEGFVNEINLTKQDSGFEDIITKISYFPLYSRLRHIVSRAETKKQKDLNSIRRAEGKLSKDQSEKLEEQAKLQISIPSNEKKKEEAEKDLIHQQGELIKIQDYLNKVAEHVKFNGEIDKRKSEVKRINDFLEEMEKIQVKNLINRWVILGTSDKIRAVEGPIKKFQDRLSSIDESKIPRHIPGPEMIAEMIKDMKCHICSREIPNEEDEAFQSLEKRLKIYEEGVKNRWLRTNFDELRRKKKYIIEKHDEIYSEIKSHNSKVSRKMSERRKLLDEQAHYEEELSKLNPSKTKGSGTNYDLYRQKEKEVTSKINNIKLIIGNYERVLKDARERLQCLNTEIENFNTSNQSLYFENKSIKYYEVLKQVMNDLEQDAKIKLQNEIKKISNELFKSYYHNPQVYIDIIDGEIRRVDKETGDEVIGSDNESQETLIRFSIINSLLKISSEKFGDSFPLIADAATSSLSWENTFHFTSHIGDNFDQVILFSKDYLEAVTNDSTKKTELIQKCKKSNGSWYWLEQVDKEGKPVGRNNNKTKKASKTIIKEKVIA